MSDAIIALIGLLIAVLVWCHGCATGASYGMDEAKRILDTPRYDEHDRRIGAAISLALYYHDDEGTAENRAWIIDQMVRCLTGCKRMPMLPVYVYAFDDSSADYVATVECYRDGDDGPFTYVWDTGDLPEEDEE